MSQRTLHSSRTHLSNGQARPTTVYKGQPAQRSAQESITPERAQALLDNCQKHRFSQSEPAAARLAQVILDGKWEAFNGETIKIGYDASGEEVLEDGWHRCRAVVISGKPIQTWVVYGITSADEVDTGRPRYITDVLFKHGEANAGVLGAALRFKWLSEKGIPRAVGARAAASKVELRDLLERHPGLRVSAASFSGRRKKLILAPGVLAFCHFEFGLRNAKLRDAFVRKLVDGTDLTDGDPVLALRRRLLERAENRAPLRPVDQIAMTILAWNATRAGQKLNFIRYFTAKKLTHFPEIE